MFYVTSEIYLNNDLGSLAVSVDNYPQKRKNHLTITYRNSNQKLGGELTHSSSAPFLLVR